jgi:hypothetical protein
MITAEAIINRIAECAAALGNSTGEPAVELAGQMISVLAVNPQHIERFMAEGNELWLDGTFDVANSSLTYRTMDDRILSPSDFRKLNGIEQ